MITPNDIENKGFSRAVRGYKAEEVDEFLDSIIVSMENMQKENLALKGEIAELQHDIEQQKNSETSVIGNLESAKQMMQDISENAERRAEIIIRNAKLDAEVIIKEAKDSIKKLNSDTKEIQDRALKFREKYMDMLKEEMHNIKKSEETLFSPLNPDDNIEVSESEKTEEVPDEPKKSDGLELKDIFGESFVKDQVKIKNGSVPIDRKTQVVGGMSAVPKKTVALSGSDIDEMLKKEGIEVSENKRF